MVRALIHSTDFANAGAALVQIGFLILLGVVVLVIAFVLQQWHKSRDMTALEYAEAEFTTGEKVAGRTIILLTVAAVGFVIVGGLLLLVSLVTL